MFNIMMRSPDANSAHSRIFTHNKYQLKVVEFSVVKFAVLFYTGHGDTSKAEHVPN